MLLVQLPNHKLPTSIANFIAERPDAKCVAAVEIHERVPYGFIVYDKSHIYHIEVDKDARRIHVGTFLVHAALKDSDYVLRCAVKRTERDLLLFFINAGFCPVGSHGKHILLSTESQAIDEDIPRSPHYSLGTEFSDVMSAAIETINE